MAITFRADDADGKVNRTDELKRHLSNHLWRIMIADEQRQHTHRTSPNAMAA
ncbi:hypothetical protein [Rhodococcus globerulus]|uniref:Transposase n=1 Tax=Rhodococcus globerulus TaxID=33008 RepID=A0ABU4C510_RHOGO|nr:hypothetical protein [Rhodococcus globerulus]MDV6271443.1 hypothetical protein [Rhodococcus globerulus]